MSNTKRTMLEWALYYAKKGIPVFPRRNKIPLTKHGYKDATTDQNQIKKWWTKWPKAEIGIPTGSRSGIFVVDVDIGPNKEGMESLKKLEAEYGPMPITKIQQTPSGGLHYLFEFPKNPPPNAKLGITRHRIGKDIETFGEKGAFTIAPSEMTDETTYKWINNSQSTKLAKIPFWLMLLLQKPDKPITKTNINKTITSDIHQQNLLNKIFNEMREAPEGNRNNTLNRLGFWLGQLVSKKQFPESAKDTLCEIAIEIGLNKEEAKTTINNSFKDGVEKGKSYS